MSLFANFVSLAFAHESITYMENPPGSFVCVHVWWTIWRENFA